MIQFFKIFFNSLKEARKLAEEEKLKKRFLEEKLDYAYLERLIQKCNENPLLRITIILKDGTKMNLDTKPRVKNIISEPYEEVIEVK